MRYIVIGLITLVIWCSAILVTLVTESVWVAMVTSIVALCATMIVWDDI